MSLRTERLKEIREQQGLSQIELARLCGLGTNQINRYENGTTEPSATYLAKIGRTLNVTVDYLLGLVDDPRGYIGDTLSAEERQLLDAFKAGDGITVIDITWKRLHKLGKTPS